jgi:bacillolysin
MRIKLRSFAMLSAFLLLAVQSALPLQAGPPPPGNSDAALVEQLQDAADGELRISYHAETGRVRFIGTSPGRPIAQPSILAAGASTEAAARGFLSVYGELFGLKDQAQELRVMREKPADGGRSFARFQQVYRGVPVLGGELVVQLDATQGILSANGEILPDLNLGLIPQVDAETARQQALSVIAKSYNLNVDDLTATAPELWIYNPALLGGPGPRRSALVWRMEVRPLDLYPMRELVLVDALRGFVALHFNQVDTIRSRRTYDANNSGVLPGNLICDESNPNCSGGDAHEVAAHKYAGATYDFYSAQHGRDSIDNAGMVLISTVHYSIGYANAFWNGTQMVYGDAYGFPLAEDVVAHELTHGVTEHESHLFYYYQSGAINEALSDIWGEFVDQVQVTDNDAGDARWEMGEDISGLGAIRDMQDPTRFGDPDRMTSLNYDCDPGGADNGGVHANSGVANKSAYLMVDGGTFNGYAISGLGIAKTAKIWYEVQTNLLTSAGDYQDLYDSLYQACTNLVGTAGITLNDCQQVRNASLATEMDRQPSGCPASEAPVCVFGSPTDLFYDNLENIGSGNWTHAAIAGSDVWYYPQNSHAYLDWDATYATSGMYNLWGDDPNAAADAYIAMASGIVVPYGTTSYLHFNHAYGFESFGATAYDGGVLEYSTNGGSTWLDAGPLFTHNGYDGSITGATNPLVGRQAFVRESHGYFSSRLNLTSLAGQTVRFRFRIATDNAVGSWGWFIDDVRIYTCSESPIATLYLPVILENYSSGGGIIVNADFESGPTGWTEYSTHGWPLIVNDLPGSATARSGMWAAWLGGDYDEISYIQQQVSVPSGSPYLAYWHWIQSEDVCGYDYGGVVINGNTVVDSYTLCDMTNTGGWTKHVVDLSAYAGQSVGLQIRAECDSSYNSNLLIDDVSFQSSAASVESARGPSGAANASLKSDVFPAPKTEGNDIDRLFVP